MQLQYGSVTLNLSYLAILQLFPNMLLSPALPNPFPLPHSADATGDRFLLGKKKMRLLDTKACASLPSGYSLSLLPTFPTSLLNEKWSL